MPAHYEHQVPRFPLRLPHQRGELARVQLPARGVEQRLPRRRVPRERIVAPRVDLPHLALQVARAALHVLARHAVGVLVPRPPCIQQPQLHAHSIARRRP